MSADTHAGAQHFCNIVGPLLESKKSPKLLVAGCGDGSEAKHIHDTLGYPVTAFDLSLGLAPGIESSDTFSLLPASVLDMPFEDATFDAVFYHHVIEHVGDAERSIAEISRVLKPGGLMYVGTPNRHRMVGYVGSHNTPLRNKVKWNLQDYGMRLRGKFRNELGAHAGFSHKELGVMLRQRFSNVEWLTKDYLRFKFGRRLPVPIMVFVTWNPAMEFVAPAIYALATK